MKAIRLRRCVAAYAAALLLVLPVQAQSEEGFENLKVLPADISEEQLGAVMGGFTDALGVNCTHCHVREPGQRPDFASDAKPEKETARVMLRMVKVINGWHLSDLPTVEGRANEVTCMTCHHGLPRPQTLDRLLADYLPDHGIEATFARYDSLRQEYYGTGAYDFSEASLIRMARRLITAGEVESALGVLDRNLQMYPSSVETLVTMADAHLERGDRNAAIARLEQAVVLAPSNGFLQRRLEELRSQP